MQLDESFINSSPASRMRGRRESIGMICTRFLKAEIEQMGEFYGCRPMLRPIQSNQQWDANPSK
jgi:hypothetical protein